MEIIIKNRAPSVYGEALSVAAADGGKELSTGIFTLTETQYGKNKIKTLLAGGIETPVIHRRGGCVREMLSKMHAYGAENGCVLALLHPFSFAFYRKFGYERAADHIIAGFPTAVLDFVPRVCELVPYDESKLPDMLKIYESFGKGRNLLLPRTDGSFYAGGGRQTYIYYDGDEPSGYVVIAGSKSMYVNHYTDTVLTVKELAYISPKALKAIFSFLRMFEGEYDRIELYDCGLCREAEMMLKHHMHTDYRTVPDIMGRVLNTKKLLEAHDYPDEPGEFTVCVKDEVPTAGGTYRVSYGGGKREVSATDNEPDITLSVGAFTQIALGFRALDMNGAAYLDGVMMHKECGDFFRAFPPVPCGVFEHF
ncbi:MAG: GNAT family N-acetyltransferase [Clostridia bacterium]|nr:GNAT family N-acetyltransferase [Clostridia bacterium]